MDRYSKALEAVRKLQNELKMTIKTLEGDEREMAAFKEQARKLRLDKVLRKRSLSKLRFLSQSRARTGSNESQLRRRRRRTQNELLPTAQLRPKG